MTQPNEKIERIWLLVLGAMLQSAEFRKEVYSRLKLEDVPPNLREMYELINKGNAEGVRQVARSWGIDTTQKTVLDGALRTLQELAIQEWVKSNADRLRLSKGVGPQDMLETLEMMTSQLLARMAALENHNKPIANGASAG